MRFNGDWRKGVRLSAPDDLVNLRLARFHDLSRRIPNVTLGRHKSVHSPYKTALSFSNSFK